MSTVPLKMNLQQTCRLCLGQGGVLSPIFAESVGGGEGRRQSAPQPQPAQPTLPSRIMACAPIQVLEGDSLPAQICHRCLYQVERSYDFKEQCETSDRVLRQYVAQLQDKSLKPESCVNSQDVPSVVKLDKKESGNENVHVDLSFAKSSEFLLSKEIKVNVLQSKLSALIHQAAVAPEEDVDSGLLESLADSDDLQIVGSEGDNMNIGEEEEPFQEEATDLSMPSKKETPLNTQSDSMDLNDDESTMDTESDNQLQICEDPIDEGISDGHGSEKLDEAGEKQSGVESMVISVDPFQMERIDASMKHSDLPSNFSLNSVKSEFEKEEYSPNENDVVENIQENTKPYACEFCPKKFADKSYMKTHQLTHLGIRPHACSYCGKGFFRRRELLRHEAVHTGIKPFTCKTCNKAFARSDKLMRHERTHGELKNFSCTQCPAVFSRKDELSRHGMCHTGERPHCCSQCFKSFFSRAELTRHEKTHAGLKPFKCDYCDQSFHRRDKLNRHARTHMMPASLPSETNVLGTVHLHDLLAAHCGQHFASEVRVKDEKGEAGEDVKVRVDGSIDARALARLNQNPDIHLIPLKQN